jgi:hypothetical protein
MSELQVTRDGMKTIRILCTIASSCFHGWFSLWESTGGLGVLGISRRLPQASRCVTNAVDRRP